MILAIDVGNTNIVVGCIDDLKTYFIERLSTNRTKTELEYAVDLKNVLDIYHIKKTEIEGCIISSVVPQIKNGPAIIEEPSPILRLPSIPISLLSSLQMIQVSLSSGYTTSIYPPTAFCSASRVWATSAT